MARSVKIGSAHGDDFEALGDRAFEDFLREQSTPRESVLGGHTRQSSDLDDTADTARPDDGKDASHSPEHRYSPTEQLDEASFAAALADLQHISTTPTTRHSGTPAASFGRPKSHTVTSEARSSGSEWRASLADNHPSSNAPSTRSSILHTETPGDKHLAAPQSRLRATSAAHSQDASRTPSHHEPEPESTLTGRLAMCCICNYPSV